MITTPVGNFHLPSDTAGRELAERGKWEAFMEDIFQKFLNSQSSAIDVGAHIGYHTVRLSHICSNGHVYAFEPNEVLTEIVQKNLAENNCSNVTFYPYAVSDASGEGYLTDTENTFLVSLSAGATSRKVAVKKLDDVPILHKIDLIKIDVEGFELSVLRGAKLLLERDKPVIVIEIWDHHVVEHLKYLSAIGYAVYHVIVDNYIAIPRRS